MSRVFVAVLLAVLGVAMLTARPSTTVDVLKPDAQLVALVEPIQVSGEDAATLRAFCLEFADVLYRDSHSRVIADTADFHDRLQAASALMFQETGINERHPGLAVQINDILAEWLGVRNDDGVAVVPLDGETGSYRVRAIQAFQAIAWAAGG